MSTAHEHELIDGYRADLESGKAFQDCAAAHRSRLGDERPTASHAFADALKELARGADMGPRQALLVKLIGMPPLHATAGESAAWVYDEAHQALQGHESELRDKIALMVLCHEVARCFVPDNGIFWCLDYLRKHPYARTILTREDRDQLV